MQLGHGHCLFYCNFWTGSRFSRHGSYHCNLDIWECRCDDVHSVEGYVTPHSPRWQMGLLILQTIVKQEIAKEGVIPGWRFFSRNVTTPWAHLRQRFWPGEGYEPEQSPAPALLLHWIFSVILIGATSRQSADVAYQILVSLYSYTIVVLVGFFTASGLLYVYFFGEDGHWAERSGFSWGGPFPAAFYASVCAFFIFAPFVPPSKDSPYYLTEVKSFSIPTVGLGFMVLGYVYYLGLMYVVPRLFKKNKVLKADREAIIVREHGEYVLYLEIVDASWETRPGPANESDVEMHTFQVVER